MNTIVRGTIQTPTPLSLSISAATRVFTSAPYTAVYSATYKHKHGHRREDAESVAERVRAQSFGSGEEEGQEEGGEGEDMPAEVYGPDTEIDTNIERNNSTLEEIEQVEEMAVLPTTPPNPTKTTKTKSKTKTKPAKALLTPEGPKRVEDIELQEEMDLLEQEHRTHSPKTPKSNTPTKKPSTPTSDSPKPQGTENTNKSPNQKQKKKQKQNQKQAEPENNEAQEEEGRFVRNPKAQPYDASLLEELEQQERALAAIEAHEEAPEVEEVGYQQQEVPRSSNPGYKSPKAAFIRANVRSKKVAKRIAPAGPNDVVGAKRAKRMPRK